MPDSPSPTPPPRTLSVLCGTGPTGGDEASVGDPLTCPRRLDALERSGLLSVAFEDRYDRFVRLACRLLTAPTALISVVEPDRQLFKSAAGLSEPWASRRETPLSHSFCAHVVALDAPFVVTDARQDPRVAHNGAVHDIGVVAYLGAPIHAPDGAVLGALCVIDGQPRDWTPDDVTALTELADTLALEVALEETARQLADEERARSAAATAALRIQRDLARESALLETTLDGAPLILYAFDAEGTITLSRGHGLRAIGLADHEVVGASIWAFSDPESEPSVQTQRVLDGHRAAWTHAYGGEVFDTRAVPAEGGGGVAVAAVVTDRVAAEREAESQRLRLRRLLTATAVQGAFDDRARAVLDAMADLLGLPVGLLARVSAGTYTCLASHGASLGPGDTLPIGDTYCDLTMTAGDLVAIDHMAVSEHRGHRCYQAIGLEAYIGVPVVVDGVIVGALSFSSTAPAARSFPEADRDLVRLAGQWAGALLEREAREDEVTAQATRLRALADAFAVGSAEDLSGLAEMLDRLRRLLGLDIGIVSHITPEADRYEVVACAVPDGTALAPRDVFDFGATYCSLVFAADDVWDVACMGASEHAPHPCYQAFGLEAYIGAPVIVDGQPYGTINFSSPTARTAPFSESSRDLVRLAARWVGGLLETTQHIARRVEAERRETEREALYRLLAENATDLVALHAPDGTLEWLSPSVEALLGYPPDQLEGTRLDDLVHPGDAAALRDDVHRRLLAGPTTVQAECRIRHADGRYVWLETLVRSLADETGAVVRLRSSSRDVTDRRVMEGRLYHQAHHDELTGLANRTLFTSRLDVAVEGRGEGGGYAVLFLDLDRFKVVNDTLGHSVGDRLLQVVAGRIGEALRPGDTVARLGGDEFAVLLDGLPDAGFAAAVAERILHAVSADIEVGERVLSVGASIGIVAGRPDHLDSDAVLSEADLAMYEAKARGRGTSASFSPGEFGPASRRLRLEVDLPRAVERGELRLAYQPLVDLHDGSLAGFEALVRWEHPELGLLLPGAFIGVAEVSGAAAAIDLWVLREASRQRAEWAVAHPDRPPLMVSVNCTGRDLLDPSYTSAVDAALERHGDAAGWLVLEITERLLVEDKVAVAAELQRLQWLGARFALDDFGTGYSSLSMLHALPVDTVKVDRSFVSEMEVHDQSRKLVETVAGLGRLLEKSVVAEGIERASDVVALRAMGCAYGQGYLFAKPLSPTEAGQLIGGDALPWREHWAG